MSGGPAAAAAAALAVVLFTVQPYGLEGQVEAKMQGTWGEHVWRADDDDPNVRRLSQARALSNVVTVAHVAKLDFFGTDAPIIDVSFELEDGSLVKGYFPNSGGNRGEGHGASNPVPKWLRDGMSVVVNGAVEPDAAQAAVMSAEMKSEEGLLLASEPPSGMETHIDKRPLFVVSSVTQHSSRRLARERRLGGTAPAKVEAIVFLLNVCDTSLTEATPTKLSEAFFGQGAGTFATVIGTCTRNKVAVTGKVVSLSICPTSADIWKIDEAAKAAYSDDADWNAHRFKVHILPDSWLDAVGMGTVGGGTTWVKDKYFNQPAMHLHEIGHNLGLHHAGKWEAGEYDDQSSAMGYCCSTRCYNFIHTWQLGLSQYEQVFHETAVVASDRSFAAKVPAHALFESSGIKIETDEGHTYVISYRGTTGFDSYLSSMYKNQVHVHRWDGVAEGDSEVTHLVTQLTAGETKAVALSSLKVTMKASDGNFAEIDICSSSGADVEEPCAGSTMPTTTVEPVSWTSTWTEYFSEEQENSQMSTGFVVGVGCRGQYCDEMQVKLTTNVQAVSGSAVWQEIPSGVGTLECPNRYGVTRLRCVGMHCKKLLLECSRVDDGWVSSTTSLDSTSQWFPASLHATAQQSCPERNLLVGIRCANTNCGKKQLLCQTFTPSPVCTPTCSTLSLECSSDGCGASCGSCGPSMSCLDSVGRCVNLGLVSEWIGNGNYQKLNLVATGLGCKGSYCADMRVIAMGIVVDAGTIDKSAWISDNLGRKYAWNQNSDALVADCPPGTVVTHIECQGKYCDNVRLHCARPLSWVTDQTGDPWIAPDWFSEEGTGQQECPLNYAITGVECREGQTLFDDFCVKGCHDYCDDKKLRCRQIIPSTLGFGNIGVAEAKDAAKYVGVQSHYAVINRASHRTTAPLVPAALAAMIAMVLAAGLLG